MPRLSLGLGASNSSKPIGGGAAPTTLPLSTPNLYISGLSFIDNDPDYRYPFFSNPYSKVSNSFWAGFTAGNLIYFGGSWRFSIGCDYLDPDNGWVYGSAQVAYKASDGTSIPTGGYSLDSSIFITSGTLIISATP